MALVWVRRITGNIVEIAEVKQPLMTEQLDISDQEYIDFKNASYVDLTLKFQTINQNFPSWNEVLNEITNIANLNDAKTFLAKLSRVVYWLARNSPNG